MSRLVPGFAFCFVVLVACGNVDSTPPWEGDGGSGGGSGAASSGSGSSEGDTGGSASGGSASGGNVASGGVMASGGGGAGAGGTFGLGGAFSELEVCEDVLIFEGAPSVGISTSTYVMDLGEFDVSSSVMDVGPQVTFDFDEPQLYVALSISALAGSTPLDRVFSVGDEVSMHLLLDYQSGKMSSEFRRADGSLIAFNVVTSFDTSLTAPLELPISWSVTPRCVLRPDHPDWITYDIHTRYDVEVTSGDETVVFEPPAEAVMHIEGQPFVVTVPRAYERRRRASEGFPPNPLVSSLAIQALPVELVSE